MVPTDSGRRECQVRCYIRIRDPDLLLCELRHIRQLRGSRSNCLSCFHLECHQPAHCWKRFESLRVQPLQESLHARLEHGILFRYWQHRGIKCDDYEFCPQFWTVHLGLSWILECQLLSVLCSD